MYVDYEKHLVEYIKMYGKPKLINFQLMRQIMDVYDFWNSHDMNECFNKINILDKALVDKRNQKLNDYANLDELPPDFKIKKGSLIAREVFKNFMETIYFKTKFKADSKKEKVPSQNLVRNEAIEITEIDPEKIEVFEQDFATIEYGLKKGLKEFDRATWKEIKADHGLKNDKKEFKELNSEENKIFWSIMEYEYRTEEKSKYRFEFQTNKEFKELKIEIESKNYQKDYKKGKQPKMKI